MGTERSCLGMNPSDRLRAYPPPVPHACICHVHVPRTTLEDKWRHLHADGLDEDKQQEVGFGIKVN